MKFFKSLDSPLKWFALILFVFILMIDFWIENRAPSKFYLDRFFHPERDNSISHPLALSSALPSSWQSERPQTYSGRGFFCAITPLRTVRCEGDNLNGQLGNGCVGEACPAQDVVGLTHIVALSSGRHADHTCAINDVGKGYCWGWSAMNLGRGVDFMKASYDNPVPVEVDLPNIASITVSPLTTVAITHQQEIYTWGASILPIDGPAFDATPMSLVPYGLVGFTKARLGIDTGQYACALRRDGEVWCWGKNFDGQLGEGVPKDVIDKLNFTHRYGQKPNPVLNIKNAVDIVTMPKFACAKLDNQDIKCWGDGFDGHIPNFF
jgi:hypothetical protein